MSFCACYKSLTLALLPQTYRNTFQHRLSSSVKGLEMINEVCLNVLNIIKSDNKQLKSILRFENIDCKSCSNVKMNQCFMWQCYLTNWFKLVTLTRTDMSNRNSAIKMFVYVSSVIIFHLPLSIHLPIIPLIRMSVSTY